MRQRLIALSVICAFSASAAHASIASQLAAGLVVGAVSAGIKAKQARAAPKLASCTLYDRDGNPVTVSCPADVAAAAARTTIAPAPAQVAVQATPLPDLGRGRTVAVAPRLPVPGPPVGSSQVVSVTPIPREPDRCIVCEVELPPPPPPVVYAPPPQHDCDCAPVVHQAPVYQQAYREEYRDETVYRPRPITSFIAAEGGHTEVTYSRPRVVAVYDSYESTTESFRGSYSESYSGGYAGGYGYGGGYGGGIAGGAGGAYGGGYAYGGGAAGGVGGGGFYPYGGVGYGAGGYAGGGQVYRARVAGRDPNGFLTWPGKR